MITWRNAKIEDLPTIGLLAGKIWEATYLDNIGRDQLEYMLNLFYAPETLLAKLEQGHNLYIINSDEKAVGYLHIESRPEDYFIHKFYIDTTIQNKGIGSHVIKMIYEYIIQNNRPIRLQVNRKNYKAINFYFKNGFTIESVGVFDIGGGYYMNDFVMIKN